MFSPCVQAACKQSPLDLGLSCEILPCGGIPNMGVVNSYPRYNGLAGTIALNLIAFATSAIIPSP